MSVQACLFSCSHVFQLVEHSLSELMQDAYYEKYQGHVINVTTIESDLTISYCMNRISIPPM